MSVASFQQALCDLIASPRLCLALRAAPEDVMAIYELSERERTRLIEVVWQRGMSTNCSLYRANRVTPLYTLLNYACRSLGDQFRLLLDQFWDAKDYQDGQFQSEVERFGDFLRQRIADGVVSNPFTAELLEFELALNVLKFAPRKQLLGEIASLPPPGPDTPCRLHPLARIVRFRHDPATLLTAAARGVIPSPNIPEQETLIVLSVVNGDMSVMRLPDETCHALANGTQIIELVTPRLAPALAEAALLVPCIPLDRGVLG